MAIRLADQTSTEPKPQSILPLDKQKVLAEIIAIKSYYSYLLDRYAKSIFGSGYVLRSVNYDWGIIKKGSQLWFLMFWVILIESP